MNIITHSTVVWVLAHSSIDSVTTIQTWATQLAEYADVTVVITKVQRFCLAQNIKCKMEIKKDEKSGRQAGCFREIWQSDSKALQRYTDN